MNVFGEIIVEILKGLKILGLKLILINAIYKKEEVLLLFVKIYSKNYWIFSK
jgi:hypothetical protein